MFLLSAEFPGVEKLRDQAQTVRVSGRCECGCATVGLVVDESLPVAEEIQQSNAVDAAGRPRADGVPAPELILFVKDGRLSEIEIVWYTDNTVREFPPKQEFESPVALWFDGYGNGA